jgi:hypothetical protein
MSGGGSYVDAAAFPSISPVWPLAVDAALGTT